jgi:predicted ABC-type ATPase
MRVFAGPNGSGKSSIIQSILNTRVGKDRKLDFGIYINADDITVSLKGKGIYFDEYNVNATSNDLFDIADKSGLINKDFSLDRLKECIIINNNHLKVNKVTSAKKDDCPYERIAQILADYLRKKLLERGEKFSFETVFSHESKVEIIKIAKDKGYKIYLYFVSTEDPEINVYRVKIVRVGKKGHDVNEKKIRERYYRSMDLMYEAAQYSYQAYFFDNSTDGGSHSMFAHFRTDKDGNKLWDEIDKSNVPVWFQRYYSKKVRNASQ